jgi:uncharacterized protein (TIGR02271 family)
MFYNTGLNNATGSAQYQIANGATVYDAAGDKVGTVAQYDPQAGYLLVEKGWLFHKDIYIPTSAINATNEDGIFLNLYKDDLNAEQYSSPQAGAGTATRDAAFINTGGSTYVSDANATSYNTTTADTLGRGTQIVDQTNQAGDIRVPVREEELVVGKEREQEGRVHVRKEVIEEPAAADVTLRREQVTVERVPYSGDATATGDVFQEEDIDVPVMGERAVVGKRVVGTEEVRIHKDVIEEDEQVSDTLRKERVVVDDQTQSPRAYDETRNR